MSACFAFVVVASAVAAAVAFVLVVVFAAVIVAFVTVFAVGVAVAVVLVVVVGATNFVAVDDVVDTVPWLSFLLLLISLIML